VYRAEIANLSPALLMLTLGIVYLTVVLSWVGYHRSISKYPYNQSLWSRVRLGLDIFILVLYAYLAFAAHETEHILPGIDETTVIAARKYHRFRSRLATTRELCHY
jgi:hypothetical protein